jgi:IS5 family transposase
MQCFGLPDEGIEDIIYNSAAIRDFVGVGPNWGAAPGATTLTKFRHVLEVHDLTCRIFETINAHLDAQGSMTREGTIVDVTLIATPPSAKNEQKQSEPDRCFPRA